MYVATSSKLKVKFLSSIPWFGVAWKPMFFVTWLLLMMGGSSSNRDIRDESFIRSKFGENCGGWSTYEFFGDLSVREFYQEVCRDINGFSFRLISYGGRILTILFLYVLSSDDRYIANDSLSGLIYFLEA